MFHSGHKNRRRRPSKELAIVMGSLVSELGQEVFVNPAKDIAGCALQGGIIKDPQYPPKQHVVQNLVFLLGKHPFEGFVILLNSIHGVNDSLGTVLVIRQPHQVIELRFWSKVDSRLLAEVFFGQRPDLPRVGSVFSISPFTF